MRPYLPTTRTTLGDSLGFERILFGSDYHPEGLKEPMSIIDRLSATTPQQVRLVTHDNAARPLGLKTLVGS